MSVCAAEIARCTSAGLAECGGGGGGGGEKVYKPLVFIPEGGVQGKDGWRREGKEEVGVETIEGKDVELR